MAEPLVPTTTTSSFPSLRAELLAMRDSAARDSYSDKLVWEIRWKKISNVCEALQQVTGGVSTVLAFVAGQASAEDHQAAWATAAGCVGTLSLVLGRFSAYASRESAERAADCRKILLSTTAGGASGGDQQAYDENGGLLATGTLSFPSAPLSSRQHTRSVPPEQENWTGTSEVS